MERIPPHNDEAERSVLGSALLSKDALFDVVELLTEDDFYSEIHKEIFRSIKELYRKSSPVDTLTVSEEIKRRNSLEMVGGRAYIAALAAEGQTEITELQYIDRGYEDLIEKFQTIGADIVRISDGTTEI